MISGWRVDKTDIDMDIHDQGMKGRQDISCIDIDIHDQGMKGRQDIDIDIHDQGMKGRQNWQSRTEKLRFVRFIRLTALSTIF